MKSEGSRKFFRASKANDEIGSRINSGNAEYGWAYRQAARKLLSDVADGTFVVLPGIFLYRHALEIYIKAILVAFGEVHGITTNSVVSRCHDLSAQLADLGRVFDAHGKKLHEDTIDTIREFQRIDPGFNCRYWTDQKGNRVHISEEDHFELEPFICSVEAALTELEGFFQETAIQQLLDNSRQELDARVADSN